MFKKSHNPQTSLSRFAKSRVGERQRRNTRRLLIEGMEERRLMAFNLLGTYATGTSPQDLVAAHVNADDILDLVTVSTNSISVQLGNGVGGFGTPLSSSTTGRASSMVVGDFTSDGVADLVTANGTDLSLFVGNGNGTFAAAQSLSLPVRTEDGSSNPQLPLSVVEGDLNGDGKLDLAVSAQTRMLTGQGYYMNYYESKGYINVLIGNGSGGFTSRSTQALGKDWIPGNVAIADVNNDRKMDVITTNARELSVGLGDGVGGLGLPIRSGEGSFGLTASLALDDLDEDGNIDTVLRTSSGSLRIQKGDGGGRFTPSTEIGPVVNARHLSVVTGDLNADGNLDLIAANSFGTYRSFGYYGGYDPFVTRLTHVVLSQGNGMFSASQTALRSTEEGVYYSATAEVQIGDWNRDGRPDLAMIDQFSNQLVTAVNDGQWVGVPGIAIADVTVTEADGVSTNAVFNVTLSSTHTSEVRVNYRSEGGSAVSGVDFTAISGTLVFAPGVTSRTVSVPISGDLLDEYDETFIILLSNVTGAQLLDATSIAIILDNDAAPSITINDVAKQEGSDLATTPFTFTVTMSSASGRDVNFSYQTKDGTANADGGDYFSIYDGYVTIPAGTTTATITAYVAADGIIEANETFFVSLLDADGTTFRDNQGVGTIVNDDSLSTVPNITIRDASIVEGNSGSRTMTFAVDLTFAYSQEIRVDYRTSNGSATTSNSDYIASSGTIRIAPNTTTQIINVVIRGDKKKEANEWFSVLLSNATRGAITDNQGIGTIINDDGITRMSASTNLRTSDKAISELYYNDEAEDPSNGGSRKRRR